ncbi:hypothetical protein G7B40_000330 [Aetokthonos hydrillicola Thurmond2011]|jgi:GTPase SAR1 family protein|uniref:Uncharacterized protein n=1 Tax=Aetokthonos hydrillicola Thurmond2011 TaxID=2712845 RepID=A0AAP5I0P1_9CYAN|nr:hypothetical protein [Aetokthonos hydrillicola]MBO3460175.1 hypothetical protein [Aetokthonos hydrillicola CCALA 1050]MBW4590559.1 hypothetical protein [Aetokthonos hydrillicola CCALA 1050]MDR9893032.1 hypothetical protein [Aetokthonos hydrillicola Thurmond2011]
MSVIVIGDRAVGKSSMILSLCEPSPQERYVVVDEDDSRRLKEELSPDGKVLPTENPINLHSLSLYLRLPRPREITVDLIDTRGEFWGDIKATESPQDKFPSAYQDFMQKIGKARYIILVLHPYQELVREEYLKAEHNPLDRVNKEEDLYPRDVWVKNLRRNLETLKKNCKSVKHFFVCLHKADLFCNYKEESSKWQYNPSGNNDFGTYLDRIITRYFRVAKDVIQEFNANQTGASKLSFFITTKKDRKLLEIPWLSLGTYLSLDEEI